jgi:aminoglycoside phosphotransferase
MVTTVGVSQASAEVPPAAEVVLPASDPVSAAQPARVSRAAAEIATNLEAVFIDSCPFNKRLAKFLRNALSQDNRAKSKEEGKL